MNSAEFSIRRKRFEALVSPNTLWLVQRLIRTDQAKPGLVIFIAKTLGCEDVEALRFFKNYKEYVNEQQPDTAPPA